MTKIQIRREELNIKRAELSKLSGVPIRTLEGWESGQRVPRDVYQLLKISRVLNCHIEDLINEDFTETIAKEKIKGLKKAVGDFNEATSAKIYFDATKNVVWCSELSNDGAIEVFNKKNSQTTTMKEIQNICNLSIQK